MSDILETMREFAKFAETKSEREVFAAAIDEITTLRARLALVDDEALVDVAVKKALFVISSAHGNELERWSSAMRAAIAAIRPHIEAAERERMRENINSRFSPKSAQQIRDETDRLIEQHRQSVSDWLEAGSWKQSGAGNE